MKTGAVVLLVLVVSWAAFCLAVYADNPMAVDLLCGVWLWLVVPIY